MTFLSEPEMTPRVRAIYDGDVESDGYVMNLSRVWAHDPDANHAFGGLVRAVAENAGLTMREKGILVTACASTLGDSYCAIAWGARLGREAGQDVAAAVLTGADEGLTEAERALAQWARLLAADPNATAASDVESLREHGYDDARIFAITAYVALRVAFSTVNDALGALPDEQLCAEAPPEVLRVVTWGRQPAQPSASA
ncbi:MULTISPECIES: carboxymuconolactone decarboxylase family protein [unclassified Nocardioides]|uniref:carboxymuconolactone decarboxylase family protein n=1 Tax=unclassified Nocardioides TaxID=2615069 RepID=UPI003613DF68